MTEAGFDLLPGAHPITPVMFPGDDGARRAAQIADAMLAEGVYVIAFSYPVVPQGKARIRVQLSPRTPRTTCGPAWPPSSPRASASARSRSPRGC